MLAEHLTPATETDESDWVRNGVVGFADSAISLVPDGFDGYARIFHPITHSDARMRWIELAERTGRVFHPAVDWSSLIGTWGSSFKIDGGWVSQPCIGSLPGSVAALLVDILRVHTWAPDHCWFGFWEGYAGLAEIVRRAPTFELPNRRYHLMEGPIDALHDSVVDRREQLANLSWPNDRAWFVATEIDFETTFIGASRSCIDEILLCEEIEVTEVNPYDELTDRLNPLAPPSADWTRK